MQARREYRCTLGFPRQEQFKSYLKFTDEIPIDWERLNMCTFRVKDIFSKLNPVINEHAQVNLVDFHKKIDFVYKEMRQNGLFHKLTNNGRNPVDVYYNWLRGYAVCEFFIRAIALIFGVPEDNIKRIGKDDFTSIDVFKRTADADLEVVISDSLRFKLEVQSGFTGVNDIKKTKIDKAIYVKENEQIDSYLIHFDVFNGQAALYCTSRIDPTNINWVIKFENSETIPIPPDAFMWKFEDEPQNYSELIYN